MTTYKSRSLDGPGLDGYRDMILKPSKIIKLTMAVDVLHQLRVNMNICENTFG